MREVVLKPFRSAESLVPLMCRTVPLLLCRAGGLAPLVCGCGYAIQVSDLYRIAALTAAGYESNHAGGRRQREIRTATS